MTRYGYYRDPEAGDDAVDATGVMGSRVSGLRAAVRTYIHSLDGNPEKIRADIRRLAAADQTFERHWLEILEVAADYRESDMSAAYALWKKLPRSQRPTPTEAVDLAALDYPKPTHVLSRDELDEVAKKMIRDAND